MMQTTTGPRHLRTLLGDHPSTKALKSGQLTSERVALDFVAGYSPTNRGFKPMVRELAFDVSELAIVTYLMAQDHRKPLVLLPAVVMGRFQHPYALYNPDKGPMTPADLPGKTVGIRSFTTTTGAWVRGILANDYGVDLERVNWITFEDPHVAEYVDTTQKAPAGKIIVQMLLDGELDAVIGETSNDPRLKPLWPDPDMEARRWYDKRGIVPVNHFVTVSKALHDSDPDAVREVFRLLKVSRQLAPAAEPDATPFGLEAIRPSLQLIVDYAAQQKLISRRYAVEELFSDLTRELR
jgi:4,5-dihydroxyphthalate decarboxylase